MYQPDYVADLFGLCMPTMMQIEHRFMDWAACEEVIVANLAIITQIPKSHLSPEECNLVYCQKMKDKRIDILSLKECNYSLTEADLVTELLGKYYVNKKHASDVTTIP